MPMDSFHYYINELKRFNIEIYRNSACIGNTAYILAEKARLNNSIWLREAGYLCDIGSVQIGPIFFKVQNQAMLKDKKIRAKLRNTRRSHVKRSMDLIDCMDDIDVGLRKYFKELVDTHHCLYDNPASYCGSNYGLNKTDFIPIKEEIPKNAQILSASVLISNSLSKLNYDFANFEHEIESFCLNDKAISVSMMHHIIDCLPEIQKSYQNGQVYQFNITSPQQKQAMASFGGGVFSKEHGTYRYSSSRKLRL